MFLVTGATGHIGNVLVKILLAEGYSLRVLVLPDDDLTALDGLPLEVVGGDVRDYPSVCRAVRGVARVFHLAGLVSIGSGKGRLLNQVNVGGTRNVIEACKAHGVKRLVYVSSIHAFAELPPGKVLKEHKDFAPEEVVGAYGKSKALATRLVLAAAAAGLDTVVLHPTGVVGPFEYERSNMGQLVHDFLAGKLYAYIDGSYDFVDVRDVARGIIAAGDKGKMGENYILSGEQISVREILASLEELTGKKAPGIKIPLCLARLTAPLSELYYRLLRQRPLYTGYSIYTLTSNSLASHARATAELDYNPRPIRESFRDTVEWITCGRADLF